MLLNAQCSKWKMYLVLVMICQATRRIRGYPHATVEDSQDNISKLIKDAYENHELLSQNEWLLRNNEGQATSPVESTILKQLHSQSDEISELSYTQRKLLSVSSTSSYTERDEIIFPDSKVTLSRPTLVCDNNNTFCEDVVGYPRQLINRAIAQNASLRFLQTIDPLPDIEQRMDEPDARPLCRYHEKVVYPKAAQDKDNQWLFVVNLDNLKQGVRIEVCEDTNRECSMIDGFAEGYQTICKQKYIYRELAALGDDGKIIKSQFPFPSSCCCHVKFTGNTLARFGSNLNSNLNRTMKEKKGGGHESESESKSEEITSR